MENKKTLYVALALVGGIIVGYMTGGVNISAQDQGASARISDTSESSFSLTTTTTGGRKTCSNILPALIISYEATSSDGPISQNQNNQDLGRFVLHANCKLKLEGLAIFNKEWNFGNLDINTYYVYKGFGAPLLGSASGITGSSMTIINFNTPLIMNKEETVMITIKGDVGTVSPGNKSQVCIDAGVMSGSSLNFLKDWGGNIINGPMNTFPSIPIVGHATCADIQEVQ